MTFRPFTVARFGIYLALAVAAMSAWLGLQAGATLDYALLRAVFVFVIFTAIGFAAEAVLTIGWQPQVPRPDPPAPRPAGEEEQV
ncbi:MAG: hypothetical protein HS107_13045 [Thermoflexaceae bacterium]|nr:hypothetical protein [Thermoflexaceae bacterium]